VVTRRCVLVKTLTAVSHLRAKQSTHCSSPA